jgi:hypothetical protein
MSLLRKIFLHYASFGKPMIWCFGDVQLRGEC